MSTLEQLRELHAGLPAEDRTERILRRIDLALAERASFPVAFTAHGATALRRCERWLTETHPDQAILGLGSFRRRRSWPADDLAPLERCQALVVVTTARQLVPASLDRLLEEAERLGVPVAVLISRMASMESPRQFAEGVHRRLVAGRTRIKLSGWCLGDSRHDGPSMPEALDRACTWFGMGREALTLRSRLLGGQLASELTSHLTSRAQVVEALSDALESEARQLRSTRAAGVLLCAASLERMAQTTRAASQEIAALEADPIVQRAFSEVGGDANRLVVALEEATREPITAVFTRLRKPDRNTQGPVADEIARRLDRDVSTCNKGIAAVLATAPMTLSPSSELVQEIDQEYARLVDELEERVLECVKVPDGFFRLVARLPEPSASDQEDAEEEEVTEDGDDEAPSGQQEEEPGAARKIADALKEKLGEAIHEAGKALSPGRAEALRRHAKSVCEQVLADCLDQASRVASTDDAARQDRATRIVHTAYEPLLAWLERSREVFDQRAGTIRRAQVETARLGRD